MNLTNPQPSKSSQSEVSRKSSDKTYLWATGSKKSNNSESIDKDFNDTPSTMISAPHVSRSNSLSENPLAFGFPINKNSSTKSENVKNVNERPAIETSQCSIDDINQDTEEISKTITILDKKLDAVSLSLSLKSCEDFTIKPEASEVSYKDAEARSLAEIVKDEEKTKNDSDLEGIIRYLYETIKDTKGPLFENLEWTEKSCCENATKEPKDSLDTFGSLQEYYDCTVSEVADIWTNTISLIGSVRDHTLKFVDEKCKAIDKEQLTLEAEMLQLAIDFAISYSKLKTDFLVKGVRKRLGGNEVAKSELENFMDSKTFAALYNDEDLAAMAQTVMELKTSVLKGEDLEID